MFVFRPNFPVGQGPSFDIECPSAPNISDDVITATDQAGTLYSFQRSALDSFELTSDTPAPPIASAYQGVLYLTGGRTEQVGLSVIPDLTASWVLITPGPIGGTEYRNSDTVRYYRLTQIG